MSNFFDILVYRPIFNLLVIVYNLTPGQDFGITIVVLTLLIRLVFMPWSIKSLRSQKKLAALQSKVKEIQEHFKNDKTAQAQATMSLYKENKVNPVSGCLPLLLQLPVIFALYRSFLNGFKPESLNVLYGFVSRPAAIDNISLGFFNLATRNVWLVVLAGLFQFWQSKLSLASSPSSGSGPSTGKVDLASMNKQMLYFFPVMIIIIGWNLPSGLVLYWAVTTLFSVFEQFYIKRKYVEPGGNN